MIYRILDNLIGNFLIDSAKKPPKCKGCRSRMVKTGAPSLFLLPVYNDNNYNASADYYRNNCVLISDINEIPTGQRACWLWMIECPTCSQRKILVQDFLYVRGEEVIELQKTFDCRDLEILFAQHPAENNSL